GTELHKGLFAPLFDPAAPEEVKRYAIQKGKPRMAFLDSHMEGREAILDDYSVADAYLYTVLNWALVTPVGLNDYPSLSAYHARMKERPSVSRAFAEEFPLYQAQQARTKG